jgi:hypothetical protein
MGGVAPAASVPISALLAPPPWEQVPIIRHGQGGSRTQVVCGYLHSEDPLFDPGLRALPPVFVVRPAGPSAPTVAHPATGAPPAHGNARKCAQTLPPSRMPYAVTVAAHHGMLARQPDDWALYQRRCKMSWRSDCGKLGALDVNEAR